MLTPTLQRGIASQRATQRGVSVVELLIAMLLGLFLVAGVYQVYAKSRQTFLYQRGLAEIQEQGRYATDVLTRSLRIAGFPGDNMPPGNKIEGTDGMTDTVTVRYRTDIDCRDTATAPNAGVAANTFRINDGNLECSGDGVAWDVYVRNVEDMQVFYGEDLDDDGLANRYVAANDAPDWANVVAARVALLVRSSDNAALRPQAYRDLLGNNIEAQDKRLRQSFITTIALRN